MSDQKKNRKPIKLKTKSETAQQFMPLLEALADSGELNEVFKNRIEKSVQFIDDGIPLYPNDFKKNADAREIMHEFSDKADEELETLDRTFRLAGRIMSMRSFGKAAFFHLMDRTDRLQIFVQKSDFDPEFFKVIKKFDVGDIVGVEGGLFRTKTGELTVRASEVKLLTKSMRPLPEKFHGLKDMETRYRQRYVDLVMTPKARDIFKKRTLIVRELRKFLDGHGFMEVETPMMQPIPGGATAKPFTTHHNALDMQLYMRIAPELYLKRLIVGGLEKVYEVGRNFRNEGISTRHNPEFTMCEFYWAYATFEELMDLTERMFSQIAKVVTGSMVVPYQGEEIDLTPGKWQRISFVDSLKEIGGLEPELYMDFEAAKKHVIEKHGEKVLDQDKLGKVQAKLFDIYVEPKLIQPTFIYGYPTDISPLSRRNDENPDITDRFELFICGREISNAFSELNDPVDQRLRFEDQVREKEAGDDEAHLMDEDYVRALEYGMPPCAGQGVGIDRLVMLLTDSASIREVILFPLLRPEG